MQKEKVIELLTKQLDYIPHLKNLTRFGPEYKKWRRDTEITIQKAFGENTRHITDFTNIRYTLTIVSNSTPDYEFTKRYYTGLDIAASVLQSMIDEVHTFGTKSSPLKPDNIKIIENICKRFHLVARQMRSRYNNRSTLDIQDEYDVQDLLHALLTLKFDDIRKEEWTPSYAGRSSRMDFLLKQEQIVLEVKKTRNNLQAKEVGEQLIIDREKYQAHPDCHTLLCFVYDPDGFISNPFGLENDVNIEENGFIVKLLISPK